MLAYVANTHWGQKKTYFKSISWFKTKCNGIFTITKSSKFDWWLTFLLPVMVYALKYLAMPVNWCCVPASCPPMIIDKLLETQEHTEKILCKLWKQTWFIFVWEYWGKVATSMDAYENNAKLHARSNITVLLFMNLKTYSILLIRVINWNVVNSLKHASLKATSGFIRTYKWKQDENRTRLKREAQNKCFN